MGRTVPSAFVVRLQEQAAFGRFDDSSRLVRWALRRSDRLALDDLFTSARPHAAAAQYASYALPFEVSILAVTIYLRRSLLMRYVYMFLFPHSFLLLTRSLITGLPNQKSKI